MPGQFATGGAQRVRASTLNFRDRSLKGRMEEWFHGLFCC
jgi:hypothetical protein